MSSSKLALLVFGVFTFIGVSLTALAYYFWQSNHYLKTKGVATQGTVVGYQTSTSHTGSGSRRHYQQTEAAVVEFVDIYGNRQEIASDVYTSPRRFHVGSHVDLWYDRSNPQRMLIAGTEEWLITTIVAGVGLLFCLAGIPNFLKTVWAILRPVHQFA